MSPSHSHSRKKDVGEKNLHGILPTCESIVNLMQCGIPSFVHRLACARNFCVLCVCVSHVFFFLLLILIYCLVVYAFLAFTRRRMHNMFWHGPRRSMRQCKTMAHMCLSVYYQHWLHCFSRSPVVMYSLIKTYTMHFDCDLCAHFSLICLLLLYSFFVSTLSLSLFDFASYFAGRQ